MQKEWKKARTEYAHEKERERNAAASGVRSYACGKSHAIFDGSPFVSQNSGGKLSHDLQVYENESVLALRTPPKRRVILVLGCLCRTRLVFAHKVRNVCLIACLRQLQSKVFTQPSPSQKSDSIAWKE